jgi:hypothetical protein
MELYTDEGAATVIDVTQKGSQVAMEDCGVY